MASISSLMGGSSNSSIYGTRNVISGLASGLDTEALIENMVSGYKNKITSLQQDRTKVGWKQDSYRSMINKMVSFSQKYTSYTSGTNLLSAGFFDSAVKVSSNGVNASKVTASGRTSSTVVINSVEKLASNARYSTVGNLRESAEASGSFDLSANEAVGELQGNLTLGYGGKSIQISFDEKDVFQSEFDTDGNVIVSAAQKMADAINEKLEKEMISFDSGNQEKASDRIKAVANDNSLSFELVKNDDKNGVWIKNASGNLARSLNMTLPSDEKDHNLKSFTVVDANVWKHRSMKDLIQENGFEVVVDGERKKFSFDETELTDANTFTTEFQRKLSAFFGDKIEVENIAGGTNLNEVQLKFTSKTESVFQVTSDIDNKLGMEGGLTSYINTSRKLTDLMKKPFDSSWRIENQAATDADGDGYYEDADGKRFKQDTDGKFYQVNSAGEFVYGISINDNVVATVSENSTLDDLLRAINSSDEANMTAAYSSFTGKFTFTANSGGADSKVEFDGLMRELFYENEKGATFAGESLKNDYVHFEIGGVKVEYQFTTWNPDMETIAKTLNQKTALKDSGYTAEVSKEGALMIKDQNGNDVTDQIVHKSEKFTGYKEPNDGKSHHNIGQKLFDKTRGNGVYTPGEDAVVYVSVNGEPAQRKELSSNTIEIDGMTLNLKGTFGTTGDPEKDEAVTFTTSSDADKIVDAVKQMVNDFNAMVKEIKDAYSTMPLQKSNGKYYEPLTEDDQADMSESAVKSYEEKAKTGLLFGDRDLSSLYEGLRNALSQLGVSGNDINKIGITTSYENGLTTIALDESTLRTVLAEDPDKVKDLFTKSKNSGATSDGLMQSLKTVLDKYAGTSGAVKGILIQKAGSTLAPTSVYQNTLQTELNNLDKQIEKWQDKISDQIDYYTKKFTALEKLMAQMNNQSGMLMGLSGGY